MRFPGAAAIASLIVLLPRDGHAPPQPITALAPVEIVLDGQGDLTGVVVAADGSVLVSDRSAGTVLRVLPGGQTQVAVMGLDRPGGLALDEQERLLIAEEHAGVVTRVEASGARTIVAAGIKAPRWLALGPDGSLYVTAHRLLAPDGPDPSEGREIVRVDGQGRTSVVATGIRRLEGLAAIGQTLVATSKGLSSGSDATGTVLAFPMRPDGTLGSPATWVTTSLKQPVGIVPDALGAAYVSSKELTAETDPVKRAIGKIHPDGRLTAFAESLDDPQGVALAPDGSLYLADGHAGRLVRFRAPSPPALAALPAFTSQAVLPVAGSSIAGALIDIRIEDVPAAAGIADAGGAFELVVDLAADAPSTLSVRATPHGGDGLASMPAEATVVHDGLAPGLHLLEPAGEAFLRLAPTVRASATDAGSGVASVTLTLDGAPLATFPNPDPEQPLLAATTLDTAAVADGAHALGATATDRAGNIASTGRTVIVDNTPPDTIIAESPGSPTGATSVMFTFTGTDSLTPTASLLYSWRLDDGPWSAFDDATSATLPGLAPGPHTFEVRARDFAGNEDLTPAVRSFSVVGGLRVTITQPATGTTVPPGAVLVSGILEGGEGEIGVRVNDGPAATQGTLFMGVVHVDPSTTSLKVVATTATGATASDEIGIHVVGASDLAQLSASPLLGVAPLPVHFQVIGVPGTAVIEWDFDGDGDTDLTAPAGAGASFGYTQPGIHIARARFVDSHGALSTLMALVHALEANAFQQMLQSKWTEMKGALRVGDIPRALAHVATGARPSYDTAFHIIASALPGIDSILPGVSFTQAFGPEAFFEAIRVEDGVTKSFEVRFIVDTDGVWRLSSF